MFYYVGCSRITEVWKLNVQQVSQKVECSIEFKMIELIMFNPSQNWLC